MAISKIETNRLILRKFEEKDIQALYLLLKDEEVNTFLPWYPVKNIKDTVYKYNGEIKIEFDDDKFVIKFIFSLNKFC